MSRAKKGSDMRLSGTTLGTRFSLMMSVALVGVMVGAGLVLYNRTLSVADRIQENAFVEAAQLRAQPLGSGIAMPVMGKPVETFANGDVTRHEVMYGENTAKRGYLYQYKDNPDHSIIVPMSVKGQAGEGLLGLILTVTVCVILAGALVAWLVGNAVSQPLRTIVDDIAQISRGDLRHRTRVRAGGEIMLLAKSIDRMAGNLEAAQEAQLELSVRERELALADEVREAMLPASTPAVAGYELGALHVDSPMAGGDFHDYIELGGGSVGLLVCDVSGHGIPAALIGAIARSYLRVELSRGQDVAEALARVNADLARDVRRGMFVTAMYVVIDPAEATASVACAGHKMPLIRFSAQDKKIRLVQPEGIALGFDKGPVFSRTLQLAKIPIEVGDRLVIANTGPVRVQNPAGEEWGEKAFYRQVLQHASQSTQRMLDSLKSSMEEFAAERPFPSDISVITVARRG